MDTGSIRRFAWAIAGLVCFGLGSLGVVIPVLPTTPFLIMAAFCFTRSSRKINEWFKSTALYRNVLENYASRRAMTPAEKAKLLIPVTIVLFISFLLMANVPVGRAVVVAVWVAHVAYFGFIVKTVRTQRVRT